MYDTPNEQYAALPPEIRAQMVDAAAELAVRGGSGLHIKLLDSSELASLPIEQNGIAPLQDLKGLEDQHATAIVAYDPMTSRAVVEVPGHNGDPRYLSVPIDRALETYIADMFEKDTGFGEGVYGVNGRATVSGIEKKADAGTNGAQQRDDGSPMRQEDWDEIEQSYRED